jgi:hypothetical protein
MADHRPVLCGFAIFPAVNRAGASSQGGWPRQLALSARTLTVRSRFGRGLQLAIVRTHSLACALSVMPGNSRRFDSSREFAALFVRSADRGSLRFGDDEHRQSMGYADFLRNRIHAWRRPNGRLRAVTRCAARPSSPQWVTPMPWHCACLYYPGAAPCVFTCSM